MAVFFLCFLTATTLALCMSSAMAANVVVGGPNGGWNLNTNLQSWASSHKFFSGDTLTFYFDAYHSVVEVSKLDYQTCKLNSPIKAYAGGTAVVRLSSPEKRYFVCGAPHHCVQGMKMEIGVSYPPPVIPTTARSSPPPIPVSVSEKPTVPVTVPTETPLATSEALQGGMQGSEEVRASAASVPGKNGGGRLVVEGIVVVIGLLAMAVAL